MITNRPEEMATVVSRKVRKGAVAVNRFCRGRTYGTLQYAALIVARVKDMAANMKFTMQMHHIARRISVI